MTDQNTLDKEIEKAFRHTAKLVPQSQRELFLYECLKISKHLIAQEKDKSYKKGLKDAKV